jgi:hypothetical protein
MKFTSADQRSAAFLQNLDPQARDQLVRQQYGVGYDGLNAVMFYANHLRGGGELTAGDYQNLAKHFGEVTPERIQRLQNAVSSGGSSESRARSFIKDLIQDTQRHRLGESYQLLDRFSQLQAQSMVDERMEERAAKEREWDVANGKDKIKPFSEWDASALNSTAHHLHVRANISEALDEHLATKPMSKNDQMAVITEHKYGREVGEIFRNRAAEERGESNTQRSELGDAISDAYDNSVADAIDIDEGRTSSE